MRSKLVVANWKMNGSTSFASSITSDLISEKVADLNVGAVLCPPFPYLQAVKSFLEESGLDVGAQDVSSQASGAYTGEVSADMLVELGAKWVIIGHSERRAYHNETDELVVAKTRMALSAGLTPICCVGETLDQRNADKTEEVVGAQINALVEAFSATGQISDLVIAYEPVWAIGTGMTATPDQAQGVHKFIRGLLGEAGASVSILYGGSVKPGNAAELFGQPDIDGGLIGGASLVSQDFIEICRAADVTES